MRLMLTVGYQHLLFGQGAEVGKILAGLDGAQLVTDAGYGDSRKLKLDSGKIEIELIPESAAMLPETKDGLHDSLIEAVEKAEKLQTEVYTLGRDKKKVEDELAALRKTILGQVPADPGPGTVSGTKALVDL